jgi:hypothetical protein
LDAERPRNAPDKSRQITIEIIEFCLSGDPDTPERRI